ncbi:hypothetical protein [Allostreptomyces psammosilenae]|uniref:Secreted protein n=1 Tax=Allostreptomyces psammosilenae TaxID=1892865 RepID=A0A852ZUR9_9ACTN|nr:hypothetical protein [Allostreptomyces psammosilenae]NYI05665.1 hypothetical protein [Allostreptomyces psammosilenae]
MRKTNKTAAVATAAAAIVLGGAGSAQATYNPAPYINNSLSISGPTEVNACIPTGQAGNNTFEGDQTITCNQEASATFPEGFPEDGADGGLTRHEVVRASAPFSFPGAGGIRLDAYCPDGTRVIGGGYDILQAPQDPPVIASESAPQFDERGWVVTIRPVSTAPTTGTLRVYAICTDVNDAE